MTAVFTSYSQFTEWSAKDDQRLLNQMCKPANKWRFIAKKLGKTELECKKHYLTNYQFLDSKYLSRDFMISINDRENIRCLQVIKWDDESDTSLLQHLSIVGRDLNSISTNSEVLLKRYKKRWRKFISLEELQELPKLQRTVNVQNRMLQIATQVHVNINRLHAVPENTSLFEWTAEQDSKLINLIRPRAIYLNKYNPFLDTEAWASVARHLGSDILACQMRYAAFYSHILPISVLKNCILDIKVTDIDNRRWLGFTFPPRT